jgi:hypothetical protein
MLHRGLLQVSWAFWNLVGRLLDRCFVRRDGSSSRRPPLASVHTAIRPHPYSYVLAGGDSRSTAFSNPW